MSTAEESEAKLFDLARKLHERTNEGTISWVPTDDATTFLYAGSSGSISIDSYRTAAGDYRAVLRVLNASGIEVESITASLQNNYDDFQLLDDLQQVARAKALKVDELIDNLMEEIDNPLGEEPF